MYELTFALLIPILHEKGNAESTGVPDAPAAAAGWTFDGNTQKFECDNKGNEDIKKGDVWQIFFR